MKARGKFCLIVAEVLKIAIFQNVTAHSAFLFESVIAAAANLEALLTAVAFCKNKNGAEERGGRGIRGRSSPAIKLLAASTLYCYGAQKVKRGRYL